MLLGNDAYADALDPTVGLGSTSELANRAPAIYAFMNQFRSDSFGLIDEELALLRGRDETLGGVAAAPTYNRLTWNFTNGDGEVAYVMNYNIKDVNRDGFIDEADAAIMYPQGHGDAWGHYLDRDADVLRAAAPSQLHLGAARRTDRRGRRAGRGGLLRRAPLRHCGIQQGQDGRGDHRSDLSQVLLRPQGPGVRRYPRGQLRSVRHERDAGVQPPRLGRRRLGRGAPSRGPTSTGCWPTPSCLPRTTATPTCARSTARPCSRSARSRPRRDAIQTKLDNADTGVNPLGLAQDALLFDLDPARTKTTASQEGQTHFEQVYERAIASFSNALTLFDYANEMKIAQRNAQNEQWDFESSILAEDRARVNELIEIFGYPYAADIGVNGTYPDGYDGPDLYHYMLLEKTDLTDSEKRCADTRHRGVS